MTLRSSTRIVQICSHSLRTRVQCQWGGRGGSLAPLRSNFFNFHAVSAKKNCQIIGWRLLPLGNPGSGTGIGIGVVRGSIVPSSCLDSTKWISPGILGQILESMRNEAILSREQSYPPPPPSSVASASQAYQTTTATFHSTSRLAPAVPKYSSSILQNIENQSVGLSVSSFATSEPKPVPSVANTASSLETTLTASGSTSASASTTPVSDTTASDTDQSELHLQRPS